LLHTLIIFGLFATELKDLEINN